MTKFLFCMALLLGVAAPAAAQQREGAKPPATGEPVRSKRPPETREQGKAKGKSKSEEKNQSPEAALAEAMKMFDKMFPEQPLPPPERLALARQSAAGLFPNGAYAGMFDELMSGMVDKVLAMKPSEFGDKPKAADADLSLKEQLAKDDPHFEERMRITRKVVGEELRKLATVVEPRVREGLARSIGRRFDDRQLRELNVFLATDTGRAFGAKSMAVWVDADVMRSFIQALPDMMTALPGAVERLEKATAHLPKPPKKAKDGEAAEESEETDSVS